MEMERRAAQLKEIQGEAAPLIVVFDFLKSCRRGEKRRKKMSTMN
jgi:hypothetical protein